MAGTASTTAKGRAGEAAAAAYLETAGWEILARNFRAGRGEIDLIGLRGDTLAFFEVKCWDYYPQGDLEYAINERKRGRIVETSKIFLDRHRQYSSVHIRFDVLFVFNDRASIRHFESAFTE